jgi:hypothetical protein
MKPKFYELLDKCIEDGINSGWQRAHKHTETPDPIWIKEQMHQAIMFEISEWFDFEQKDTL